jgi:hypothetical protein
MFLRLNQCVYAPLYALFMVGPCALLIEMWWNGRRAKVQMLGASAELAGHA